MSAVGERPRAISIVRVALLSTTWLFVSNAALADGGTGGAAFPYGTGGVGGSGASGAAGGNGTGFDFASGGGGGGGGAGGGRGGNGADSVPNGGVNGPGAAGNGPGGGGGGGAGGTHGATLQALSNGALVTGGPGFAGGNGSSNFLSDGVGGGGGGGGGAGGYGVIVTGDGASLNAGSILGGSGGAGGRGGGTVLATQGGGGGDGGVGIIFNASSASFTNLGGVLGGNGGSGGSSQGKPGAGGAGIVGGDLTIINDGTIAGGLAGDGVTRANAIVFTGGTNVLALRANSNIQGNVVLTAGTASLTLSGRDNGTFNVSQIGTSYPGFSYVLVNGNWTLAGIAPLSSMPWIIDQGTLSISADASLGAPTVFLSLNSGTLQSTANFTSMRSAALVGGTNTFDTAGGTSLAWNGVISGSGGLAKTGLGTLILGGSNTYTGGTIVSDGILQGDSRSLQGNIVNNASLVFNQAGFGIYAGMMTGTGTMTLQGGGQLTLTGASTYASTYVNSGKLVVNGSLASTVFVSPGGAVGGNGRVGDVILEGGSLTPGNSIGTLTVANRLTMNGGTHQVEIDGTGIGDRVNVGSRAILNGGTVQVIPATGSYANKTTYTILNAAAGVAGTYANVTSNLAFLTPSLSYDPNNVYLTLALQGNAFSAAALTANQRATGSALDRSYATASGDFASVIGALAGLTTAQAPAALNAISGQQYANFGTTNVANASLFMNTLERQMANARGASPPGTRVALAQACEVEACDTARPLSAWFSGLGGLGSVLGDANSGTLTYNLGGAAVGIDYRLDPRFLLGLGIGYASGTQRTNGLPGQGWSNALSLAAYGSFTHAGFYADALAGYAYLSNQMKRQIQVPNLLPRTANGGTGANQFLTQLEIGYKLGLWRQAMTATPFARLQFSTTAQNAFSEAGAQSLNLDVAQQTTNSLRSVLGAEFASSIGLANQRALDLALRLGWQHEFASTARPITAAFAGAPGAAFTVYGAAPARDAAIIGLSAATTVADATQLYLRYDGMLGAGTDSHAFTAGFRFSW